MCPQAQVAAPNAPRLVARRFPNWMHTLSSALCSESAMPFRSQRFSHCADAGETYTRPSSQSSRPVTQSGTRPGSRKDHSRQNTYSRVGLIPVPPCIARMHIYKQNWLEPTDDSVYLLQPCVRDGPATSRPSQSSQGTGTTFDFLHVETTNEAKQDAEQSQPETNVLHVEQEDASNSGT